MNISELQRAILGTLTDTLDMDSNLETQEITPSFGPESIKDGVYSMPITFHSRGRQVRVKVTVTPDAGEVPV